MDTLALLTLFYSGTSKASPFSREDWALPLLKVAHLTRLGFVKLHCFCWQSAGLAFMLCSWLM